MRRTGQICYDHLGKPYCSKAAMAEAWGVPYATFTTRITRKGWTLEQALTTPVRKTGFTDPTNGKWYETQEKMCIAHGMNIDTYRNRVYGRGCPKMTPYEALTTPVKKAPEVWVGIHDDRYKTQREMCEAYGLTSYNYMYRIKQGWTHEAALTTPINKKKSDGKKKRCRDHNGKEFESKTDMLNHWKMPNGLFYDRLAANWTLKEALETPAEWWLSKEGPHRFHKDHEGNIFKSLQDMCNYWSIPLTTYKERVYRNRMSVKQALTTPLQKCEKDTAVGGSLYAEIKAMSQQNGVPMGNIKQRIELGWNVLEAGTIPVLPYGTYIIQLEGMGIRNKQIFRAARSGEPLRLMTLEQILEWVKTIDTRWKDHKGNYYANFKALCAAYPECTPHTVATRLRNGMPMWMALDPRPIKKGPKGRELLQREA